MLGHPAVGVCWAVEKSGSSRSPIVGLCSATHGFTVWGTLSDNLSFVICDTLMLMPSHNVVMRTKDNVSDVLPSASDRGGARGVTAARAGRRSRISTGLNLEGQRAWYGLAVTLSMPPATYQLAFNAATI